MRGQRRVALLETIVLGNVVQVVTANDNRPLHLGRLDDARQDAAANRHVTSERALLVDVLACAGASARETKAERRETSDIDR